MTKQEIEAHLRLAIEGLAKLGNEGAPPKAQPEPIWLDVARFAERRGVSVSTVRKWLREGLPAARRERVVRIRVTEAEAWLDAGVERVRIPTLVSARNAT